MILLEFDNYFKDRIKIDNDSAAVEQRKTLRQLRTTLKSKEIRKGLDGFLGRIVTSDYVRCRMSVNNEIQADSIELKDRKIFGIDATIDECGFKQNYYQTDRLINALHEVGLFLFEVNNRYKVARISDYDYILEHKRQITAQHYVAILLDLKKRKSNASRDLSNNRIYSNFTHLAGSRKVNGITIPALIDFFTIAGERIYTFDLQNSQVTLAFKLMLDELNQIINDIEQEKEVSLNWLEDVVKTKDATSLLFRAERIKHEILNLMKSGKDFYEYFRGLVNNENQNLSRSRAKRMIFEIIFSSKDFNSTGKKLLEKVMPEFVAFIAAYKKEQSSILRIWKRQSL